MKEGNEWRISGGPTAQQPRLPQLCSMQPGRKGGGGGGGGGVVYSSNSLNISHSLFWVIPYRFIQLEQLAIYRVKSSDYKVLSTAACGK